ncbi:MAG: exo-alpha-sialidase, partial [Ignavibacteria bacterium]|nr:exo-alpha-sialidase [Ignavibacteria bacterium]
MKKLLLLLPLIFLSLIIFTGQKSQDQPERWNPDPSMTRIYAESEYIPLPQNDNVIFSTATRMISLPNGVFAVSPNFRVHPSAGTQSETPITRHPLNQLIMLGSANTYRGGSTFSTGVYVTTDGGATWFGSDTLNNGGFSFGDPGPVIDKNGTFLMSYITTTGSMGASYSSNNGINWAPTVTFPGASTSADKNLSGTDDSPSSAYYGRSYTVYTEFAGTYTNRIVISYTANGGVTWSSVAPVSPPTSSGHHHQGCDVRTGPNGEVYVVWANCTTNGQNSTEDSLGFAKSLDGGVTWALTTNSADNMNGIRSASLFNSIRANGFPRIDVDRSGGPRNGWIYVVTGEKTDAPATDVSDVILHKSTNGGTNWTSSRVNQDAAGNGKYQYMPAVRVDEFGGVNVIFYDTRNTATNDSAQIYVARSVDGGSTWSEILVSDHKFKPKPISGLATGYQGDYIGITS